MNFAFITDKDTLYFYPLNEYQTESLPIQAMDGARYILTESSEQNLLTQLSAQRVEDDLHLRANANESGGVVINDFFQFQSTLQSLTHEGEVRMQVSAETALTDGPVVLQNIELGEIAAQPDAIFLHAIQNQTTLHDLHEAVAARSSPEHFDVEVPYGISGVFDRVGAAQGEVTGFVTDDVRPLFQGAAQPGSTLVFMQNNEPVDVIDVGPDGLWSYVPADDFLPGAYVFHIIDAVTMEQVGKPVSLLIDDSAPPQPMIDKITAGAPGSETIVTSHDTITSGPLILSGVTERQAIITIYEGKNAVLSIQAGMDGSWQATVPLALLGREGLFDLRVTATDFVGNISQFSPAITFNLDSLPPDAPTITDVVDYVGDVQGTIESGAMTDDAHPTLFGHAESYATVFIYSGNLLVGQTEANEKGEWSLALPESLPQGQHELTAKAQDAAGNLSAPSAKWVVVVNTDKPQDPVIDGSGPGISLVIDDVGPVTGPLSNGDETDDRTPTFSGTGNAGDIVVIYDGEEAIG
ncbi:Ig-like domain-containing protein, partial [Pseudomonas koreensis]|uniref:Ig-like domain-containing protein n=1 Tax=Pseudomonas koreensis TaxID=198620 RepID=UPI00382D5EDC